MSLTRRSAVAMLAGGTLGARFADAYQGGIPAIAPGPFHGTRDSLQSYRVPEWFRDAKFGIWAHWGPQSAAESGDWYARNMYMEGSRQYKIHLQKYGHPTKFGYKDIIPTWKAEQFDPEHLMDLYHKAGAKYFVSMGVHHDNFDLWNSRHQRWNAVQMGPKKDVVGLFRAAALKRGLKFGVSEHLAVSYHWFQTSHGADKDGPYKGVPYDGAVDKAAADLYHEGHEVPKNAQGGDDLWSEANVPETWKAHYFARIKDLIDNYQPDLMYIDGPIFFEQYGLSLVAHLYNQSAKKHGGKVEAVYTSKRQEDSAVGTCLLDVERGVVDKIWPGPWQTDTCVGQWHYNKGQQYKTAKVVIDMLVDIVSRNGNLLLNFPVNSAGSLDEDERKVLAGITDWMAVNSEGIYGTRPWKIFGQGPATSSGASDDVKFNERNRKTLGADDVRFTTKGKILYAFCMGVPERQASIPALALGRNSTGKVQNVELVGFRGKLKWKQDEQALTVDLPEAKPSQHAIAFRVIGA